MAQMLLLFISNKHKKCEMQKHKESDNINVNCRYCDYALKSQLVEVSISAILQLGPKILVGKHKYGCRYCNKTPKF
jgi:aspartate carbamoyltransferase regulatory subunit